MAPSRCVHCRSLVDTILREEPHVGHRYKHFETFGDLEQSALRGCDMCALFRRQILFESDDDHLTPADSDMISLVEQKPVKVELPGISGPSMSIGCVSLKQIERVAGFQEHITCHYGIAIGKLSVRNDCGPAEPEYGSMKWPTSGVYELIKSWIRDCINAHNCSRDSLAPDDSDIYSGAPNPRLPTRVIDVSSTAPGLKIVESNGREGLYLALSYCWGPKPYPYVTTAKNIDQRLLTFDSGVLPKTIRDAVEITRSLGIQYLWVDALCIKQSTSETPDNTDWISEAPKMSTVYGQALCTIIAAGAKSAQDGCFVAEAARKIRVQACQGSIPESQKQVMFVPDRLMWYRSIGGPVEDRAWTLQESVISPRKLYWSRCGIFWECRKRRRGEAGIYDDDQEDEYPSGYFLYNALAQDGPVYGEDASLGWKEILHQYTARQITVPTDKLVALAGIARIWRQHHHDDQYVAGHWRSDLIPSLSWEILRSKGRRYSEYVAPSWSWASMEGRLHWTHHEGNRRGLYDWTAEVLEVDMRPVGDQFGALKSGRLRLRGRLRKIEVGRQDCAFPHIFSPLLESSDANLSGKRSTGMSRLKKRLSNAVHVGKRRQPVVTSSGIHTHNPDKGFLRFDEAPESTLGIVYCFQLSIQRKERSGNVVLWFENGLILQQTRSKDHEYCRVGIFSFPWDTETILDKVDINIV